MLTTVNPALYPNVEAVRHELTALKPHLPIIGGDAVVPAQFDALRENGSVLFTNPVLRDLTDWFTGHAQVYSETDVTDLRGYIGMTMGEQLVRYLHQDSFYIRVTLNIADSENRINPSTLKCPPVGYSDIVREQQLRRFANEKTWPLPDDIFEPQKAEGEAQCLSGRTQFHTEMGLLPGTAKVLLTATL